MEFRNDTSRTLRWTVLDTRSGQIKHTQRVPAQEVDRFSPSFDNEVEWKVVIARPQPRLREKIDVTKDKVSLRADNNAHLIAHYEQIQAEDARRRYGRFDKLVVESQEQYDRSSLAA